MEIQAYYIQVLLADELDRYKGKGNVYTDNYIRKIQDVYQNKSQEAARLFPPSTPHPSVHISFPPLIPNLLLSSTHL